jgi:predicted Zn-dependent protease
MSNRTRFVATSPDFEKRIGKYTINSVLAENRLLVLPQHDGRTVMVTNIVKDLVTASELSLGEWQVYVIDSPLVNAFAIPGGSIVVYTGMLSVANTKDRLAAVLGHEIAHVVARHSGEALSMKILISIPLLLAAAFFDVNSWGRAFEKLLISLPHSRKLENEADYIGLRLMAKACYEPAAAVELWQAMGASGSKIPAILSTHPSDEDRVRNIRSYLPEAETIKLDSGCGDVSQYLHGFLNNSYRTVKLY